MNIKKLLKLLAKPKVYEKGNALMWTDEYISKQLLEMHLNPMIDAASRIPQSIDRTLEFLRRFCKKIPMQILDLGCGPGIYTEKLAASGHHVTGVDFSQNSIAYAKDRAKEKNLDITYLCKDYLKLDLENQFDLVILIYTDFGVLLPDERKKLLKNIHRALKPGGAFIFDVLNDKNMKDKFREDQTWTCESAGFWRAWPYLELANGYHYPDEKVFLKQHLIVDKSKAVSIYRFWISYFNTEDTEKLLSESGFTNTEVFENILPALNIWSGKNVSFYKTEKK
jgi:SAM-dependent methyltransferase